MALKYLCNVGSSNYSYSSTTTSNYNPQSSQFISNIGLQNSNVSKYSYQKSEIKSQTTGKNLTTIARKRLDVARRLFKMFDKDESGFLTEDEIPYIIEETYKEMGQSYKPTR